MTKHTVEQKHYPDLEIDNSERDIVQVWMHAKDEPQVIQIERAKLESLIMKLTSVMLIGFHKAEKRGDV